MALKFRHIDTQTTLNTIKFSADSTNTTYFLHSSPNTQSQGTPDVNYEDICFIKPTGQEYTHGKLYSGENDNKATALLDEYLNKTKLTHPLPQLGIVKGIILDGCEPSLNYNTNNQPNGYKISNGTIYLIGIGIIKVIGHRVHTPNESSEWFVVYGIHETSNTDKTTWDYHIYGQTFGPDYDSSILDEGQVANDVCRSLDLYRLSDLEVPVASDLQNGLMSKEDKKKLDNHTDEYLDYLHKLCTEHSKDAIILSGCTVEPTNVQDTYQRKGGYVYIDSINQIKKVNDGTISYSTTIEDSLYCNSQNGGNGKIYAFGDATNPSNLSNQYAKVCDWSDLTRLSDLEVPMATEYQNGLVKVDSELSLSSTNPIANNAITNALNITTFTSEWRTVTQSEKITYWTILNGIPIPDDYRIVNLYSEIRNTDGTLILNNDMCTMPATTSYGTYAAFVLAVSYPVTYKVRLVANCIKYKL